MNSINDFLNRSSERNGFFRGKFEERKLPTDYSDLVIMPFFGDLRSMTVMSSLLLQRYRQEIKNSKYFIFASWPGFQGLFPYVDEYWSLNDQAILKKFYEQSNGFENKSEFSTIYRRNLNEFFRDVIDSNEINSFYEYGFKNEFFEKFKTIHRFLPYIPSSAILGKEFNKELSTRAGYKIFIHPSMFAKQWFMGQSKNIFAKKEFWIELVNMLIKNGFMPVIWQNYLSYDISQDFVGKCLFIQEADIINVLSVMRATGCVLDVFNNISRLAILARCPYLCVDERARYFNLKEYEIDCLCGNKIPNDYIFTFSTIITEGNLYSWEHDLFNSILVRLNRFLPSLNRDEWAGTAESTETMSYAKNVKVPKHKKMGMKFLKVNRD